MPNGSDENVFESGFYSFAHNKISKIKTMVSKTRVNVPAQNVKAK